MTIPFKCIDCEKSLLIMYGAICEQCKRKREEEE